MEDVKFLVQHGTLRTQLIHIDSNSRDRIIYPDSESYSIKFETPFTNVVNVEIVDVIIPKTMLNINEYNNVLKFKLQDEDEGYTTIDIPESNYSVESLANAINIFVSQPLVAIENGVIRLSDAIYEFDYNSTLIKNVLYISFTNLSGETYLNIHCNEIEPFVNFHFTSYTNPLAKVPLQNDINYVSFRDNFAYRQDNFHPIGKLSALSFRFTTANNNLYNFHKQNHAMTLAIQYYQLPNQYFNYNQSGSETEESE